MKRVFLIVIALLWMSLSATAQYFTGFNLRSYKITSAYPTSFRSVAGSVKATVGNTGQTRTFSGVSATLYRKGEKFTVGTCDSITLFSGTGTYSLKGRGHLAEGVSTWEAIRAALSFRASDYTMDFSVDITYPDGHVGHVERVGRPVSYYMGRSWAK